MILDSLLEFADAESVAASAGTALIGDVVNIEDLRNLGVSEIYLVIQCSTSIITGGAAGTIQFKLASDDAAAIAVDGSASEHIVTQEFVTDGDDANDLDAGDQIYVGRLPLDGSVPYEQYLGILCVIATQTVTAGAINAFLTLDPSAWKAYADASN